MGNFSEERMYESILDVHTLWNFSRKHENIAIIVSANTTKFKRLHWQQSRSFHSVCTMESRSRIEKKARATLTIFLRAL